MGFAGIAVGAAMVSQQYSTAPLMFFSAIMKVRPDIKVCINKIKVSIAAEHVTIISDAFGLWNIQCLKWAYSDCHAFVSKQDK